MSANLMRITRGAGAPEALIAQAKDIVFVYEALKEAGLIEGGRDNDETLSVFRSGGALYGADVDVVHAMREALDITRPGPPNPDDRIVESFVAAGLRIAAGRLLGDATQEGHGLTDLEHAITAFRQRAAE
jgi:hypothetical protein